ncbi:NifU family protein [Putridiphycobacter roseus]|uniref:NifU family protein n=1 Tax=Putridiphycobacter roseus TaxID=2219161 RepID=A0A2W1MXL5_9FLAO|nr:NifU family protein [Putridiphycobacter roseus]PZE16567.1 NifU family protein [Putridiphycobacter roseus]
MQVPITLYAEMTPNPATMKFVSNKHLVLSDQNIVFNSMDEAKGYSPLAEALFNFPFVDGVFMASNFVTVTKTDNIDWDFIVMELREFIREWLANGKEAIIRIPAPGAPKAAEKPATAAVNLNETPADQPASFEKSDLDEPIIALLNEYVRPAVENDGGAIDFIGFNDGKVYVMLKGSCAGCPSSTQTLKGGIETLLKSNLEEVTEVVAYS